MQILHIKPSRNHIPEPWARKKSNMNFSEFWAVFLQCGGPLKQISQKENGEFKTSPVTPRLNRNPYSVAKC